MNHPALPPQRIGVVELEANGWTGGAHYWQMLLHSLKAACESNGAEMIILSRRQEEGRPEIGFPARIAPVHSSRYRWGERPLRRLLRTPKPSSLFQAARDLRISVLLPMISLPAEKSPVATLGWIPDFQHVHLPELFSDEERAMRDERYHRLAERADLVMLSSTNAREDFVAFTPTYADKARVVSFPSIFAFEPPQGEVQATRHRFHLPEKFALVSNQFWRHKNHAVVVAAAGRLRRKGLRIPIVMTGLPVDYRDPHNSSFSHLLQQIAMEGISDQVYILGLVSLEDLVNLTRCAAMVIQPSRFEGWSTSIENTKALGRPLLCSDIPVHREQVPDALGIFPWNNADALADLLAAYWPSVEPGPDPAQEHRALSAEREFARQHGQSLLGVCREAASLK